MRNSLIFCRKCFSGLIDYGFSEGGLHGLMCCACKNPINTLEDIVFGRCHNIDEEEQKREVQDAKNMANSKGL